MSRRLRITIFLIVAVGFLSLPFSTLVHVRAADACEDICQSIADENSKISCLNNLINSCQAKVSESQSTANTLQSAINTFNGQIKVLQLQINQNLVEISKLEKEISELSDRIEGLNYSLDKLTAVLVERVGEHYKRGYTNPVGVLFSRENFSDVVSEYKYLNLAKKQTAEAMERAESQKITYNEQKSLKEEKQTELEKKKNQLLSTRQKLDQQKVEKQHLLEITKNDEKRYQQLLAKAQAEVDSLRDYTISKGGASLLSGTTKCDDWGCYYNQRDSQWGNQRIGQSSNTMASVGCLVTSAAMVATHYGESLTPLQIAQSTSPFEFNTADMRFEWLGSVNGAKVSRQSVCSSSSCLDSELSTGKPVIVRIKAANSVGTHFLVITKKEDGKYIMKDPYEENGNNISFTDKHSMSQITRVDRVTVY